MGDRVSLSFQQKAEWYVNRKKEEHMEQSPALFHHWGGTHFPKFAFQWFKKVKEKYGGKGGDPFTRMEPRNLMVQFIAHLRSHEDLRYSKFNSESKDFDTDDDLICYSIYLGKDSNDGDNSDNGHYIIDVDKGKMYNDKGESIE
jgi:hypothetical protein